MPDGIEPLIERRQAINEDLVQDASGEEPILRNAPTYLPMFPHDMAYVMKHLDLV